MTLSNRYVPAIELGQIRFGRQIAVILIIHMLSVAAVFLAIAKYPWLCVLSLFFIAISLYRSAQAVSSITQANWREDGSWVLKFGNNHSEEAELFADSCVFSWLLILNFKTEKNRNVSLILLRDSIDRDIFRKLAVRLRLANGLSAEH
jgi:hypothetical protein